LNFERKKERKKERKEGRKEASKQDGRDLSVSPHAKYHSLVRVGNLFVGARDACPSCQSVTLRGVVRRQAGVRGRRALDGSYASMHTCMNPLNCGERGEEAQNVVCMLVVGEMNEVE